MQSIASCGQGRDHPQKKVKSIPEFLKDDAPFGRVKVYQLIASGDLETVRIGGRQYIKMASFERLIGEARRSSVSRRQNRRSFRATRRRSLSTPKNSSSKLRKG
jgi:hypothetical protein